MPVSALTITLSGCRGAVARAELGADSAAMECRSEAASPLVWLRFADALGVSPLALPWRAESCSSCSPLFSRFVEPSASTSAATSPAGFHRPGAGRGGGSRASSCRAAPQEQAVGVVAVVVAALVVVLLVVVALKVVGLGGVVLLVA